MRGITERQLAVLHAIQAATARRVDVRAVDMPAAAVKALALRKLVKEYIDRSGVARLIPTRAGAEHLAATAAQNSGRVRKPSANQASSVRCDERTSGDTRGSGALAR
jgi:hypothetical protein